MSLEKSRNLCKKSLEKSRNLYQKSLEKSQLSVGWHIVNNC